ncbi:hypothetical protein [Amycolatopsis sp. lyj-90]|uniref:hypothetical protein n=1 Tax=Amycolatopsis sp. lyj-90 TaxID=2789285 RepID=UPI003979A9EC
MALTVRKLSLRLGAVLLSAVASLALVTGPAYADVVYDDSFEGNPADRWGGIPWGDGSNGFDIGRGLARTGANNGWLLAENGGSALAHHEYFPNSAGQCAAQIYVKPSSNDTFMVLEVWGLDPNSSGVYEWRRRNYKEQRLNSGSYQAVGFGTTASTFGGTRELHYRVFLHGGGPGQLKMARLDDFYARCW